MPIVATNAFKQSFENKPTEIQNGWRGRKAPRVFYHEISQQTKRQQSGWSSRADWGRSTGERYNLQICSSFEFASLLICCGGGFWSYFLNSWLIDLATRKIGCVGKRKSSRYWRGSMGTGQTWHLVIWGERLNPGGWSGLLGVCLGFAWGWLGV